MKITFVCPPLNMSGGIRVIAIYAKMLKSFGHDVSIVAQPAGNAGRLNRLLKRLGLPQFARHPQPPSHVDGSGVPLKVLKTVRSVREGDVPDADVVVATWWETAEFVARMSPRKGRPVYFVQGYEHFEGQPRDRVAATYRSDMPKIAVAQWLVSAIANDGNRQGCTVVPNAVDRSQFFAEPRGKNPRPRLGTLFSEHPNKGFDIALDVIASVRKTIPDLEVVAFGQGSASTYVDRIREIQLTLRPEQSDLREIYSSCDVWLCCSKSEGFNLVAMEAMACRTPVVSTRTGWPEEAVVEGVNGALADVDDVEGLARGVLQILTGDATAWRTLSDGAARTVEDSSWEHSARMFERALIAIAPPAAR